MAATDPLGPYDQWTDAPGVLFNKSEWEAANASHPETFDFGSLPEGWPTELTGPLVWTGDDLERNRTLQILLSRTTG